MPPGDLYWGTGPASAVIAEDVDEGLMNIRYTLFLLVGFALHLGAGPAIAQHDEIERLENATIVFEEIMRAPDNAVPRAILDNAEAIAIIPNTVKAGFIIGGHRGKGVISARSEHGGWSQPAFLTLTGGSFGLQIGGQSVDLVLVIMNRKGLEKLLQNEFKFGGDASAVVGPVGREAEASTDLYLRAEILSYSRTRGLFAGITLKGSTMTADRDANERFYGYPFGSAQLVLEEEAATPRDADAVADWRAALAKKRN
jgi:lipid-binding SYLF domain-containing protein